MGQDFILQPVFNRPLRTGQPVRAAAMALTPPILPQLASVNGIRCGICSLLNQPRRAKSKIPISSRNSVILSRRILMSTGSLKLEITDLRGNPANDLISVALTPVSVNAAGSPMATAPTSLPGTSMNVTGIQCFGAGTAYTVSVSANNFQTVPFIKIIQEGDNSADPVRLPVNPPRW